MPFYPSRNSCSNRILSNLSDKELQNDCNLEWNNVKKSSGISIFNQVMPLYTMCIDLNWIL